MSKFLFSLLLLGSILAGCTSTRQAPQGEKAEMQLARAEREWLDAYDTGDRKFMTEILADGFSITFPNGEIDSRQEVIDGLNPSSGPQDRQSHFTEGRQIRLIGNTAILTGVYVNPGNGTRPDRRSRYTDTWMWLDGRWKVVASHLSEYR